jgi:hypothetical protein
MSPSRCRAGSSPVWSKPDCCPRPPTPYNLGMLGIRYDLRVLLIEGLISLLIAICFFVLGTRWNRKRPMYFTNTATLVKDFQSKAEGLEVLYGGQPVQSLLRTYVGFWNAGHGTIDGDDLNYLDPTVIAVKDAEIFIHSDDGSHCLYSECTCVHFTRAAP